MKVRGLGPDHRAHTLLFALHAVIKQGTALAAVEHKRNPGMTGHQYTIANLHFYY